MTHILIVDDKPENLYLLSAMLSGHGCHVTEARHGAEALAKARQEPPQLVISDLLMPVMDGYTLLRHWKMDERLRQIPFVVYTATYTEPKDERLALDLGADGFIIKPTEPEPFMARIQEILSRQKDGSLPPVKLPEGEAEVHFRRYSESLIHKLEEKALQLEQANRALERDIAQRRQAEAEREKLQVQLAQAQKMESVGRLAGGVAHDFNNLLGVILGYVELALEKVDSSDPLREDLLEIHHAATRSAEITRQLLTFARKQSINPRILDLNETIENMLNILRRLISENIELIWRPGSGLWRVMADPSQIDQILANLCVNARDAITGSGTITMETGNIPLDDTACAARAGSVPGQYVFLAVSDDGCGMDAETISHLFEPFFTTKELGKGTGLGLATVYGIVRQNKGFIDVRSEPARGTTFTVYLPRYQGDSDAVPTGDGSCIHRGNGEIVLVVDDDAAILKLARKMLSGLGYQVLEALDAESARKQVVRQAGEVRGLLVDLTLPGLDGEDLARSLRTVAPRLRVMYMSGDAPDAVSLVKIRQEDAVFIQKPFSIRDLAFQVHLAVNKS